MEAIASAWASPSHPRGGEDVVLFIMAATSLPATARTSSLPDPSAA
jgi:hypothetical protein